MLNSLIKFLNPLSLLSLLAKSISAIANVNIAQVKFFSKKYIGLVYSGLIAFNLILLNHYVFLLLNLKQPDYFYFQGAVIYFNPHKRTELLEYIFGCLLLGIWFLVITLGKQRLSRLVGKYIQRRFHTIMNCQDKVLTGLTMLATILIPLVVFVAKHYDVTTSIVQSICLLISILVPLWGYLLKFNGRDLFSKQSRVARKHVIKTEILRLNNTTNNLKLKWLGLLIIIGFLFLVYIFYIPIFQKPHIINEYFNIPEQSILTSKIDNKKIINMVDNTAYWDKYFASPTTYKSDVTNYAKQMVNCLSTTPKALGLYIPELDNYNFYYNYQSGLFCINGIPANELFKDVIGNSQLYNTLQYSREQAIKEVLFSNVGVQKRFLSTNKYEIHWQILSRFMIHHNSFMFVPIDRLMQGESRGAINAQYGNGSSFIFAKIFEKMNGISLDKWLKVSYSFYFIYFTLLLFCVWCVTRNIFVTTALFLISLATVNFHGYDFVLLAPGDSPWRNLFDISVILLLYLYTNRNNLFYYICAIVLGLLSTVLNPQMGIMILVAVVLSGIFNSIQENRRHNMFIILNIFVLLFAMYLYRLGVGHDDLAKYYIDGVIGFKADFVKILFMCIGFVIGYLVLFSLITKYQHKNYLYLLFLVIYAQELFLYVVWHFNADGFMTRSHIYFLTACFLFFELGKYKNFERFFKYLMMFAVVVYAGSVVHMIYTKNQYEKIFKQHVTYDWNLDRAHITSTMNPIYFENGIKLIDKYSSESNGIYIVSEYDNFLPFLAHKHSLMPFFDMKWYLITPKELNKAINLLQQQQPKYLFVDTGIDRNLNNEVIDPSFPEIGYLYQESLWRVQRLKLLNMIYQSVAQNYTLIESGSLISVYKLTISK